MQRVNNQENVVTKKKGKEIEVLRRKENEDLYNAAEGRDGGVDSKQTCTTRFSMDTCASAQVSR
ncbi:hypothetical protein GQ55_5G468000 [Panicum hallii var. hallii]|uniref:Uncharacterized protein n=2 Tax=Panicum hallii TaxID=206008 RepID=A0A2T7DQT0_9POAL|nr:hypothetical protein GQ55_5G468000 [Panicum hallii var. hallii]PVH39251.1 hypothetical protein PAHAL_5G464400 [Panicum hallii]